MDISNQDLQTFGYYYSITLKNEMGETVPKETATRIDIHTRNSDGKYVGMSIKDTGKKFTIESLMKIVTVKKSGSLF